jgi:hypothetical protein
MPQRVKGGFGGIGLKVALVVALVFTIIYTPSLSRIIALKEELHVTTSRIGRSSIDNKKSNCFMPDLGASHGSSHSGNW